MYLQSIMLNDGLLV